MVITLQAIQEENLRDLYEIRYGAEADLEWMKYNAPYFREPVMTWEDFNESIRKKIDEHHKIIWKDGVMVGEVSAYWEDGDLHKWLETGIALYKKETWGQGIATVALKLWIEQLFDLHKEIKHIGFTTWSGNSGMMKVGEKLGMTKEGEIRQVRYWQGKYYDSIKYGILREEIKN